MTWIYFLILAVLVVVGFLSGRPRARGMRCATAAACLHSLPTYHGFYLATAVSCRCC